MIKHILGAAVASYLMPSAVEFVRKERGIFQLAVRLARGIQDPRRKVQAVQYEKDGTVVEAYYMEDEPTLLWADTRFGPMIVLWGIDNEDRHIFQAHRLRGLSLHILEVAMSGRNSLDLVSKLSQSLSEEQQRNGAAGGAEGVVPMSEDGSGSGLEKAIEDLIKGMGSGDEPKGEA